MKETLDQIAIKYGTDKATVHSHPHGYTPHYERFLEPIRPLPLRVLEIGVAGGASIRMWLEYFQNAAIYGVDNIDNPIVSDPRYTFVNGDQASQEFWSKFLEKHGREWDLVIDDGGHFSGQVIMSFNCLWPNLSSGGIYVIEDVEVVNNPMYQTAGFPNHMEFIKEKMDFINNGTGEMEWLHFSKGLMIAKRKI